MDFKAAYNLNVFQGRQPRTLKKLMFARVTAHTFEQYSVEIKLGRYKIWLSLYIETHWSIINNNIKIKLQILIITRYDKQLAWIFTGALIIGYLSTS